MESQQHTTNRRYRLWLASFTLLLFISFAGPAWGQGEPVPLGLAAALELAASQNPQLRAQQASTDIAGAQQQASLGVFLPRVSVSETAVFTNSPLNAFGFLLQQQRVTQADFNPATLNSPGNVQNYLTQVDLQQPIINLDGWQYRQAAKAGAQAAEFQRQYTLAYISYNVRQVYFGIQLAEKSQGVLSKAQKATEATLKVVADNVAQGYLQRSDELAVRVRLSELQSQMLQATDQAATYRQQLNQLLGMPEGTSYALTDTLAATSLIEDQTSGFALGQRPDMQAYAAGLEGRSRMLARAKSAIYPNLNAFGAYSLYDRKPFGGEGTNYQVGLRLQWDLFTGLSRKSNVQKAEAESRKTQAEFDAYELQAAAELAQAARALAIQRQELTAAELAVGQAEEAYRILNNRFAQGLERTNDLLIAETTRSAQALRLAQTQYLHYVAQAKLMFLTTTSSTSQNLEN